MVLKRLCIITSILLISLVSCKSKEFCFEKTSNKDAVPSPINIDSSKVIPANTTKPLTLFNAVFDFVNLTNTGKTLDAYSNQLLDPSFITGGPLCDHIYKIHTIRFYINPNVHGYSGDTVDDQGTPLQMLVVYYKLSYGSLENAMNFPDGITVLGFPVKVSHIPSPTFLKLQIVLSSGKLKYPHSSIKTPGLIVYIWFDNIAPGLKYYAYKGSYYDPEIGKLTAVANYMLIDPYRALSLSYSQFSVFKKVEGLDGKPLKSAPPTYPQGSAKVYKIIGIEQVLLPVV